MIENLNFEKKSRMKWAYSFPIYLSIVMGPLVTNLLGYTFSNLQYYYTKILLFPAGLYTIALGIYTVWNMVNDPFLGFVIESKKLKNRRFGKYFPFVIGGLILYSLTMILVFTTISDNVVITFIWLIVAICLLDSFQSMYSTSATPSIQTKFPKPIDRKRLGAIEVIVVTLALLIGVIMQPQIVAALGDNSRAWLVQAVVMSGVTIVATLLAIPGYRETDPMKEIWVQQEKKHQEETPNFFKILKRAVKNKNFVGYLAASLGFQITVTFLTSGMPFFVTDVLGLGIGNVTGPLVVFALAAPVAAPVWFIAARKIGSRKVFFFGCVITTIALIPMFFVQSLTMVFVVMFFVGIGYGAIWTQFTSIFGAILDEFIITTGNRQGGVYVGINTFFSRTTFFIQAGTFALVQFVTNYDPEATQQIASAETGIRLLLSFIPAAFLLIGLLVFNKLFKLTPEKIKENHLKIKELGL